jgi:hypothetical protein
MKSPDLSAFVTSFFRAHLAAERNVSQHTTLAYRDALKLFLRFAGHWHKRQVDSKRSGVTRRRTARSSKTGVGKSSPARALATCSGITYAKQPKRYRDSTDLVSVCTPYDTPKPCICCSLECRSSRSKTCSVMQTSNRPRSMCRRIWRLNAKPWTRLAHRHRTHAERDELRPLSLNGSNRCNGIMESIRQVQGTKALGLPNCST